MQNSRFVNAESHTSHSHLVDRSGGTHSPPHTLELARAGVRGGEATVGNGQKRSETVRNGQKRSETIRNESRAKKA